MLLTKQICIYKILASVVDAERFVKQYFHNLSFIISLMRPFAIEGKIQVEVRLVVDLVDHCIVHINISQGSDVLSCPVSP